MVIHTIKQSVLKINISALYFQFIQRLKSHRGLVIGAICCLIFIGYLNSNVDSDERQQTIDVVSYPQINDIYFFDLKHLTQDLRPKEKYRLAKVVDITGDIITLTYGRVYYPNHRSAFKSIVFGQLTYPKYFESKRFDYHHSDLTQQLGSGAIYRAMRPIRGKLFGRNVLPEKTKKKSTFFIQGKKENQRGVAFLNDALSETSEEDAYKFFSRSAQFNYAPGQVNLAQFYINGQHVEKDLNRALYWLNKAALQSYKPAILKYEIVCKQVKDCQIYDFFENLIASGVNVKVRSLSTKITSTP